MPFLLKKAKNLFLSSLTHFEAKIYKKM